MKNLFLLGLSLLMGTAALAQDDARSKPIVDRLMAQAKTWTSFEADFSSRLQSTKDKLDVKQEGNMKVKGKKFRLQLDKNTIINDGTTLNTYNSARRPLPYPLKTQHSLRKGEGTHIV